jgi:hypothetical protein
MTNTLDNPFNVLIVSLIAQWVAAYAGDIVGKRGPLQADVREEFIIVRNAALTLLALVIGFSFSMAVTRYDQRKNYEEAEANAIGTAYVRADLLPTEDAARVRDLLRKYADQRVQFYLGSNETQLSQISADAAKLQAELWSAVSHAAATQPTAVVALAVSGMNDVLNSQGYTQAAWWNRIPVAAWWLLGLITISCNFLIGYGDRRLSAVVLTILPLIVSVSFFLIADIDSPRGGIIRVHPQDLFAVFQSMTAH